MIKTRTWILILSVTAVLLTVLTLRLLPSRPGVVAEVVQDGVVIEEIDLRRVTEAYSFTVPAPDGGSNTVLVQPGRIRVSDADCPEKICVEHGWLAEEGAPIVCLPHRLVIRVKGASGADAVSR